MSYSIFTNHNNGYGNISITGPYDNSVYGVGTGTSTQDIIWNTTNTWPTSQVAPVTITQKATIDLKGDDADIIINGESLKDSLKEIKEALRIPGQLKRDPKMEEAWEELKAVKDQYNKLLKEYKEKQKVWETLKDNDI